MNNTIKLRENKQLLRKLLNESIVASKADQYPGFKPKQPWPSESANFEKLIISLGGKPYPLPYGGLHAYEFKVGDDIIKIYQDKKAYSTNTTNTYYAGVDKEFSPNGITLFKTPALKGKQGAIERVNGRLTWKPVPEDEADGETKETWVDYVQYALTIFGVIPGVGDVADVINAAISFYRYNDSGDNMYLIDGFINLIGAIPVVGSAIAIPFKAAMKGIKGVGNMLEAAWRGKRSATEVWAKLHADGIMDPKTLNMLADGMGTVGDIVKGFRNRADWALNAEAAKALDEFADFMYANRKGAQDVFTGAAKRADDIVQGGGKIGRGKGILKSRGDVDWGLIGKLLPRGIRNAIGNAFSRTLSAKELAKLRGAMAVKFARKADNPAILASIAKTNLPGAGNALRTLDNVKDLETFMRRLKNTDLKQYEQLKSDILSKAVTDNNPLLKNFMNSEANALKTFISQPGTFIGSAFARWQNMVPVVWNDIKDMGEDVLMSAGIETKDDINGFFWPLLKSGIGMFTSKDFETSVSNKVGSGYETVAGSKIGTILGAPLKSLTGADDVKPYDPNIKFQIVPDEDPRLKTQKEKKKKDIQQRKSWF